MARQVYPPISQSADSRIVYQSIDDVQEKPYSGNRSRSEQRHNSFRKKSSRTKELLNSSPERDLEDYSERWLNGLDSHGIACSCKGCRARNKQNKYSRNPHLSDIDVMDYLEEIIGEREESTQHDLSDL